jgi:hypothetical protein
MALSLARASAQVQAYVDFLHQYSRLSASSLKRLEDRRVLLALAQTVQEGKRPRLAGYEFSAVRLRSVSGVGSKPSWALTVGSGLPIRCALSLATASRRG